MADQTPICLDVACLRQISDKSAKWSLAYKRRKLQIFPHFLYLTSTLWAVPLEFCNGGGTWIMFLSEYQKMWHMPIRLDTNGVVFPNYKNDMTKKCHNSLFNASARSVGKSSTDCEKAPRWLAAHSIAGLSLILAATVTATTAGQRRTDGRTELLKQYRALHSLYADAR